MKTKISPNQNKLNIMNRFELEILFLLKQNPFSNLSNLDVVMSLQNLASGFLKDDVLPKSGWKEEMMDVDYTQK